MVVMGGVRMSRSRVHVGRWVAVVAAITLIGAIVAPAATAQQKFPAVDQPGVTDKEIKVGGVATVSNDPTGNTLGTAFDGTNAYFDYINSTGGVCGRKLVLSSKRDDGLANNREQVQGLISDDDVFAVLPVAVDLFSGADLLVKAKIPTFGWLINPEWGSEDNKPGPPNFFGTTSVAPSLRLRGPAFYADAWLPQKLSKKRVGVARVQRAAVLGCADGLEATFKKFPDTGKVVFKDTSLPFGSVDYSAQVAKMMEQEGRPGDPVPRRRTARPPSPAR